MPITDEDQPARPSAHRVGEDLTTLSLAELGERISLLRQEIDHLEAAIRTKEASAAAADAVFKAQ